MNIRKLAVQLGSLVLAIVGCALLVEVLLYLAKISRQYDVMVILVFFGELLRVTTGAGLLVALALAYFIYRRIAAYLTRKRLFGFGTQTEANP